jgi:hypothetical protein
MAEKPVAVDLVAQPRPALVVTTHVNECDEFVDAQAHCCVERAFDLPAVAGYMGLPRVDRLVGQKDLQLTDAFSRHADNPGKVSFAVAGCLLAQREYPVDR